MRDRRLLRPLHFNPGFAHQQHVRDQLGESTFRRLKLHPNHTLSQDVIKIVEITGDLASAGKVQGRLQMADDENGVVDAPGPALDSVVLDGDCGLPEILDQLLIKPHHELYRARTLNRRFSIRLLDVHDGQGLD
jgi:hypothetical protein